MRKGWTYDRTRGCYDHAHGCVAKDRPGAKPWCAYYGGNSASPKGQYGHMSTAMAMVEAHPRATVMEARDAE